MTCEDFKKRLNQIAAALDEEKEKKQAQIHKEALDHLKHVKKERLLYQANTKVAKKYYKELSSNKAALESNQANSKDIMAHYSWDFAQQLHYPFEDQQVGPIFFKTPKKAQLFGICCEGIPRQYNYLIDEDDFYEKNANTVISLLDHFFTNYSLGEKWVHLTADNCVGQNKNNAVIQYLMYRVFAGLHDKIELSFLVVGHTKFSPDAFFGLIKRLYRRAQIYT
jgi:predicted transcriptional regulator